MKMKSVAIKGHKIQRQEMTHETTSLDFGLFQDEISLEWPFQLELGSPLMELEQDKQTFSELA